jgi:hypothetical protein
LYYLSFSFGPLYYLSFSFGPLYYLSFSFGPLYYVFFFEFYYAIGIFKRFVLQNLIHNKNKKEKYAPFYIILKDYFWYKNDMISHSNSTNIIYPTYFCQVPSDRVGRFIIMIYTHLFIPFNFLSLCDCNDKYKWYYYTIHHCIIIFLENRNWCD